MHLTPRSGLCFAPKQPQTTQQQTTNNKQNNNPLVLFVLCIVLYCKATTKKKNQKIKNQDGHTKKKKKIPTVPGGRVTYIYMVRQYNTLLLLVHMKKRVDKDIVRNMHMG